MMEMLSCPLCCSTSLTDGGTVFQRRWDHEPDEAGVYRGVEVIVHHAVFKCGGCSAASINGPGVDVPGELVAGVMRRVEWQTSSVGAASQQPAHNDGTEARP